MLDDKMSVLFVEEAMYYLSHIQKGREAIEYVRDHVKADRFVIRAYFEIHRCH